ncbi:hypothetical protein ACFQ1S_40500 [Kibdelosporangium lantanae]|uniref:Uncharacterized protein n=1 Tax=Kibdelosporangium lantanae TaxID=1497396 RepID=A0ABW3MMV1_9PSEU
MVRRAEARQQGRKTPHRPAPDLRISVSTSVTSWGSEHHQSAGQQAEGTAEQDRLGHAHSV